ncbi:MAG: ribonuclease HII [Deltaproteobacteria bacterium]|nr:ribonuclease HII [Deltaproteobacteria bacterium]
MTPPTLTFERQYLDKGYRLIAGVDEVGRGCLAGPVVAGAVIFNCHENLPDGIDDSKKLSPAKRLLLDGQIRGAALAFGIGYADVDEIDKLNIFHASRLAMVRAISQLNPLPDFVLVDGNFSVPHSVKQHSVVAGDQKSVSIAAASILAKVYRDNWMNRFEALYPGFGFAKNKGYGTFEHRQALTLKGPTEIHRKTFCWTRV